MIHVEAADIRARILTVLYGHLPAREILAAMLCDEYRGRLALVSSFGAESAVLLHMVSEIDPATPIVFLDTGKLFGETRRYRDELVDRLGLTGIRTVQPDPERERRLDPDGVLWANSADSCCFLRKVEPLSLALAGFDGWITGRKAYQGGVRRDLRVFEAAAGHIKVNPLARWRKSDIEDYFIRHALPRHPLEQDGYLSIGCMPCTDRVKDGEDDRAGRWRGREKSECGIHFSLPRSSG
ncbi:MAG: phosphoadenylyl-sulfate reductase [Minwuiales bacterium]|nr:phosphoadenylyl-sulfate reductase [Minwuiales bacterium]